jgi:hypothetical protein
MSLFSHDVFFLMYIRELVHYEKRFGISQCCRNEVLWVYDIISHLQSIDTMKDIFLYITSIYKQIYSN